MGSGDGGDQGDDDQEELTLKEFIDQLGLENLKGLGLDDSGQKNDEFDEMRGGGAEEHIGQNRIDHSEQEGGNLLFLNPPESQEGETESQYLARTQLKHK